MKTNFIWMDEDGRTLHWDIPGILREYGIPVTKENMDIMAEEVSALMRKLNPDVLIIAKDKDLTCPPSAPSCACRRLTPRKRWWRISMAYPPSRSRKYGHAIIAAGGMGRGRCGGLRAAPAERSASCVQSRLEPSRPMIG